MPSGNLQHEARQHGEKAAGREQLVLNEIGQAGHRRPRWLVSVGPEDLRDDGAENTVIGVKDPWLVRQIGQCELATSRQWKIGRASCRESGALEVDSVA